MAEKTFPAKKKGGFMKALLVTGGRIEYFTADLTPYITGIFLGIAVSELSGNYILFNISNIIKILLGLIIVILAHYATVHANVLADYEMDKKFKNQLSQSVDVVGHKRMGWIIGVFIALGALTITALNAIVENRHLIILWIIGMIFAMIYSFEPIRLKKYPFLGDIARGLPLVITMPFGYYIFANNFHPILLYFVVGISINLFGLFMVGEVWDWKDDKGIVNTVAVVYGYKTALKIGLICMPLGVIIWLYGFEIIHKATIVTTIYSISSIAVLVGFMIDFILRVFLQMDDYDRIEVHCGIITKAGTTLLWLVQLAGAVILALTLGR